MKPKKQRSVVGKGPALMVLAAVERITARRAMGVPLRLALAWESPEITAKAWAVAIKRRPDYRTALSAAKAGHLMRCVKRLDASKDVRHLQWVLKHRHPEIFGWPRR